MGSGTRIREIPMLAPTRSPWTPATISPDVAAGSVVFSPVSDPGGPLQEPKLNPTGTVRICRLGRPAVSSMGSCRSDSGICFPAPVSAEAAEWRHIPATGRGTALLSIGGVRTRNL